MLVSGGGVSLCCFLFPVDLFEDLDLVARGILSPFPAARLSAFRAILSLVAACRSANVPGAGGMKFDFFLLLFLGGDSRTLGLATIAGLFRTGREAISWLLPVSSAIVGTLTFDVL